MKLNNLKFFVERKELELYGEEPPLQWAGSLSLSLKNICLNFIFHTKEKYKEKLKIFNFIFFFLMLH